MNTTSARTELPVLSACCTPATTALPDEAATSLASLFKALADPARVKIMSMLLNAQEVCACDVASGIGKSAATTSHHLKLLRAAGLVATDRRGTWIYYRVLPERLDQLSAALQITPLPESGSAPTTELLADQSPAMAASR